MSSSSSASKVKLTALQWQVPVYFIILFPDRSRFGSIGGGGIPDGLGGWRAAPPGFSGCAPCRLRCHGHSAAIPPAFAPEALRASLTSWGKPCGLSPPRGLGAPRYRRTGGAGSARVSAPPYGQCTMGTPGPAAAGCANACRPRRWRFVACVSRRTDHGRPLGLAGGSTPRVQHGCLHRMGRVPAGRWGVALPGSGGVPVSLRAGMPSQPWLLSDWGWFGPRRPCVVVNPGGGAGFMSATFQPK
jgi:hypothetical protein